MNCLSADMYNGTDSGRKEAKNTNRLSQKDLETLVNGPKQGESMPPNSDPNSLDGNLADKRRQQGLVNDLASRIQAAEEKKSYAKAKETAGIIMPPSAFAAATAPKSEAEEATEEAAEEKEAKREEETSNEKDASANAEMKRKEDSEEDSSRKGEPASAVDCAVDPHVMTDEVSVACYGRHLDGRPSATDGMILV